MLFCIDCKNFIKEDRNVAMRHIIKKHKEKMKQWYKSKKKIKIFPTKEDCDELCMMFYKTTVK